MNEETKYNASADTISSSDPQGVADDEMLDEYDFSQAVRGNPYQHLSQSPIKINTSEGNQDIQIKTVEVLAIVAADGKVTLQLPPDITPGEHHITLLIQENQTPQTASH
ncbi:hypothetical protein [Phormidesmis priestleyi]